MPNADKHRDANVNTSSQPAFAIARFSHGAQTRPTDVDATSRTTMRRHPEARQTTARSRAVRAPSSIGSAGSIGWCARSSAFCSCATSFSACFMSSIDSGVPQCAHAAPLLKSTGPPQLAQFTEPTFSPQLRDLLRRQRTDEVLLAQEVEEADEPTMPVRAIQILEPRGALHVLRSPQPPLAARTLREVRVRCAAVASASHR